MCFNLCPLPLVLSVGATARSLPPLSFLSHQAFAHIDEVSLSPVFSRLKTSSSLIFVAPCWTHSSKSVCLSHWGAQDVASPVLSRLEGHLPQPLAMLLLMYPRILLAFFSTRAHCRLLVSLLSSRTPKSFSAKLLSSQLAPARTDAYARHGSLFFVSY